MKPQPHILVTKEEAARSQLDTAIRLWFEDKDPVSTHTLAGAAVGIIRDLYPKRHKRDLPAFAPKLMPAGMTRRKAMQLLTEAEKFFKHARKDPEGVYPLFPFETALYLYDAVRSFIDLTGKLDGRSGHLFAGFALYFACLNPSYFSPKELALLVGPIPIERLQKFSKRDFLSFIEKREATLRA